SYGTGVAGALSVPTGSAGLVGGSSSIRGLKFGSTSTTPIFWTPGGGPTRGPREPRRNRALRDGMPPGGGVEGARPTGGGGAAHEGGRGGRLGHGGIQRLVGVAHGRGLGCGSGHRGGRLLAELHLVRPVALLRQVDDLGVVRLAQQLGEPLDLERLCFTALELDHRLPQLVGAHGLVTATQARQRLFEQTERPTPREAPPPTPRGSPAAPAFVAPSPPPSSSPRRLARLLLARLGPRRPPRLGGGPGHAGTQRDLVLAVVELGEMDQ